MAGADLRLSGSLVLPATTLLRISLRIHLHPCMTCRGFKPLFPSLGSEFASGPSHTRDKDDFSICGHVEVDVILRYLSTNLSPLFATSEATSHKGTHNPG